MAGRGGAVRGITFDLAEPHAIAPALADIGPVHRLALVAIDRDTNSIADYDIDRAIRLVTLKLVGFTAVVSALRERLTGDASLILFGGMAKERPYPGSTTVSTVNGGVTGLTRSLVEELKPLRVNAIHPGSSAIRRTGSRVRRHGRELHVRDADRTAGADGRDRQRDRVPAREPGCERRRPDRRRRLALPVAQGRVGSGSVAACHRGHVRLRALGPKPIAGDLPGQDCWRFVGAPIRGAGGVQCGAGDSFGPKVPLRPATLDGWNVGTHKEMTTVFVTIKALLRNTEDGQGLAEYALILALIAIVAIVSLMFLGGQVSTILSTVGEFV